MGQALVVQEVGVGEDQNARMGLGPRQDGPALLVDQHRRPALSGHHLPAVDRGGPQERAGHVAVLGAVECRLGRAGPMSDVCPRREGREHRRGVIAVLGDARLVDESRMKRPGLAKPLRHDDQHRGLLGEGCQVLGGRVHVRRQDKERFIAPRTPRDGAADHHGHALRPQHDARAPEADRGGRQRMRPRIGRAAQFRRIGRQHRQRREGHQADHHQRQDRPGRKGRRRGGLGPPGRSLDRAHDQPSEKAKVS